MPERGLCRLERQNFIFSYSSDEKVNVSTRFLNLLLLLVLVFALQQKKRNYIRVGRPALKLTWNCGQIIVGKKLLTFLFIKRSNTVVSVFFKLNFLLQCIIAYLFSSVVLLTFEQILIKQGLLINLCAIEF